MVQAHPAGGSLPVFFYFPGVSTRSCSPERGGLVRLHQSVESASCLAGFGWGGAFGKTFNDNRLHFHRPIN